MGAAEGGAIKPRRAPVLILSYALSRRRICGCWRRRCGNASMEILKTIGLFVATALAEIVGCYLPYLWLKQDRPAWLLVPAAISLSIFAWLLSLHPTAAGRVYAAYGGVYIGVAILWLWLVDKVVPTTSDWVGVGLCFVGMAVIMFGPRVSN